MNVIDEVRKAAQEMANIIGVSMTIFNTSHKVEYNTYSAGDENSDSFIEKITPQQCNPPEIDLWA